MGTFPFVFNELRERGFKAQGVGDGNSRGLGEGQAQ